MNRVEDLSLEQLRDEVWYWREDAAASLFFLIGEAHQAGGRHASRRKAVERLRSRTDVLESAMRGEYHPTCFACALPIRPGDAVISDVTEGEMHADCPTDGRAQTIRPGDKVFMDPESIVIDEDHPEGGELADKPDHIVAHEATRLYTHERMIEKLQAARAAIEGRARPRPLGILAQAPTS